MLLDIAQLPTAENSAIRLHPADNVAIARVPLAAGTELRLNDLHLVTQEPISAGHKVALLPITAGETVRRYGQSIGRARMTIEPGRHVHTHDLAFEDLQLAYEFPLGDTAYPNLRGTRPHSSAIAAKTAASALATTLPSSRPATAPRTRPI